MGRCLYKINKYNEAIVELRKALELDHTKTEIYFLLASCYIKLNKYKPAINAYNKAKLIDPDNPRIYICLANCYKKINKMDLSQQEMEIGFAKSKDLLMYQ